ncbi:MAG: hypothetical protein V4641_09945 [Pseudomonadota bacterium]
MSDVHAFEDALKGFEDLTAAVAQFKAEGWKLGLGDLGALWTLLGDLKTVAQDVPDIQSEAGAATVADWQKLGGRAVADVIALLKIVTG